MQMTQAQHLKSSRIRSKTVGNDTFWLDRLVSQQSVQQHQRRLCVSPALDDEVQDLSLIVNCAPQEHTLSTDRTDDLIQMPARGRGGAKPLQPPCDLRPELDRPAANGLIANVNPARGHQLFNVAETQAEAKVEPHGMADDLRRETVALER